MEEILKFENRDKLYQFLIEDFGFEKIEEKQYSNSSNFYITLLSPEFLLRYNNDRLFLDIEIASLIDQDQWLSLSFIRAFIYHKDNMYLYDQNENNNSRIEKLNDFLKINFDKISELYGSENYLNTRTQIKKLLEDQFKSQF